MLKDAFRSDISFELKRQCRETGVDTPLYTLPSPCPLHHPCTFQLDRRQTPWCGRHRRPNPPGNKKKKKRSISGHTLDRFVPLFITINCFPVLPAFPRKPALGRRLHCNMSAGLKAVIQISPWPLGRKGCFSPSLQRWNPVCVCVCSCVTSILVRILNQDVCNLTPCFTITARKATFNMKPNPPRLHLHHCVKINWWD